MSDLNERERQMKRVRLVSLIGKFCNVKRQGSGMGGNYRKLIDVGETYLIFEGDPKAGGGTQTLVEEIEGIQEIQFREDKSMRGPFR